MNYYEFALLLLPWTAFIGIACLFHLLINWAKKRKTSAIALGVMIQMFLPDPNVQKTIETIVEVKQEVKKQQDDSNSKDNAKKEKSEL